MKISLPAVNANPMAQFLDPRGMLVRVYDDGTNWKLSLGDTEWKLFSRRRSHLAVDEWRAAKQRQLDELKVAAPWRFNVKELPTHRQMNHWLNDGVCETPTGHRVELDGHGPDGVPSWFICLGMV